MLVELEKEDPLFLVRGNFPHYSIFQHPLIDKSGCYVGGHVEKWIWNNELTKLDEKTFWSIYELCKNSWK